MLVPVHFPHTYVIYFPIFPILPLAYTEEECHEIPSHFPNMKAPDSSQYPMEKSLFDNSDTREED
jgi:hypothetical protein